MTKRPFLSVAICFLFGLLFSLKNCYWILIPFLVLEVYIFLRLYKYNMKVRGYVLTGLLLATFFLAVLRGNSEERKDNLYLSQIESGKHILIQGRLYKKESKNKRYYLYLDKGRILLKGESVPCGDILIISDSMDYILGNTLVVNGVYEEFEMARNEGGYDEKEVYAGKGVKLRINPITSIKEYGNEDSFREYLYRIKEKMKTVMGAYLKEEDAGVLASVVLGDKTELSVEDKEAYSSAGISHILSVSGLHISLLCMGFFALLRKVKMRVYTAIIVSTSFSIIYCMFTGASVSTVRAVGMFIVSMIAMALGEAYDTLSALSLLGIIILISNPDALFSAGFLLSFGAVIGITITGNKISGVYDYIAQRRDFLRKRKRELYGKKVPKLLERVRIYFDNFEKMLLVNIGIILTTFPFVAWFYYEVPTLSLIVNILVIPLMGVFLGLGFIGSILGVISNTMGCLLLPCGLIAEFYRIIAKGAGNIKGSKWIVGRPNVLSIVLYFAVLIAFLVLLEKSKILLDCEKNGCGEKFGYEIKRFNKLNLLFSLSVVLLSTILILGLSNPRKNKPCIKMLDVGQGDGIYMQTITGEDIFIDGGSSSVKQVGKYVIAPFLKYVSASDIECWIISHTDEDHVSGLIELLEDGYNIENIYLSKYVVHDENFNKIRNLCNERKINLEFLEEGDVIDFGKERITCLYPYHLGESGNDSSMVMFYEAEDYDALFTGDMGKEQEQELMHTWTWPKDGKKRILKVAHHGSKNSSDENFLEMCEPDISLISAGKNNSYGHPHPTTLEKLEKEHSKIHRTDLEGEITVE